MFSVQCIERTIAKQRKSPGQSRSQVLSCYPPRKDDKEFEECRFKSVVGRRSSYVERNYTLPIVTFMFGISFIWIAYF